MSNNGTVNKIYRFYKLTVGLKFNRTSASFSSGIRRNGAAMSEMPKHSSLSMKISKTELVIKQLNVLTYRRITSILGYYGKSQVVIAVSI
jgi:hypothetical protein